MIIHVWLVHTIFIANVFWLTQQKFNRWNASMDPDNNITWFIAICILLSGDQQVFVIQWKYNMDYSWLQLAFLNLLLTCIQKK